MATLSLVILLVVFFVTLGRSGVPRDDRLPWAAMNLRDVVLAVVAGCRVLHHVHDRRWGDPAWRRADDMSSDG